MTQQKSNWKQLSTRLVYENPWLKLREDKVIRPDGSQGVFAYMDKDPGVSIIAFEEESNSIFFIEEFRYPIQKFQIKLPAGKLDTTDTLANAKKELLEEANITAEKWERLGGFHLASGHEKTYENGYLATKLDLSRLDKANGEHDEFITQVMKVKITDVKQMILKSEIECGVTIAALNLFFLQY